MSTPETAERTRIRNRLGDDAREFRRLIKSELDVYGEHFTKTEKRQIKKAMTALEILAAMGT